MERPEQIARFTTSIEANLQHYAREYDLTAVEVIGVLQATVVRLSVNILKDPPWNHPPAPK